MSIIFNVQLCSSSYSKLSYIYSQVILTFLYVYIVYCLFVTLFNVTINKIRNIWFTIQYSKAEEKLLYQSE